MAWSGATETEADDYLLLKPETDAWFATGLNQTKYLTTAFRNIFFDPDYVIPTSPTSDQDTRLDNAQIELAFYILITPGWESSTNQMTSGVKSFKVGNYSETFRDLSNNNDASGYSKYPTIVADYLKDFLKGGAFIAKIPRANETGL